MSPATREYCGKAVSQRKIISFFMYSYLNIPQLPERDITLNMNTHTSSYPHSRIVNNYLKQFQDSNRLTKPEADQKTGVTACGILNLSPLIWGFLPPHESFQTMPRTLTENQKRDPKGPKTENLYSEALNRRRK